MSRAAAEATRMVASPAVPEVTRVAAPQEAFEFEELGARVGCEEPKEPHRMLLAYTT